MPKVFVTDGRSIATLAIIKSLSEKGIEVTCGEEYRSCPAFFSKYVKHRMVYPSPEKHPDYFVEFMYNQTRKHGYDVIIPVRDDATLLLSKYKEKFNEIALIPIGDYDTIRIGRSKIQTLKAAISNKIQCPKTWFLNEVEPMSLVNELPFPVLIRPSESSGARGIIRINGSEEYKALFSSVTRSNADGLFIQEYIPSEDMRYLVHVVFNRGIPVAGCVIKALRFFPDKIGPTTYGITEQNDTVLETTVSLLKSLNWHGVAEVEFIVDKRDKQYKLMEINPRFGNPVALAVWAGIDIPYMLYQIALDKKVNECFCFKQNIKWRWILPADILWYLKAKPRIKAAKTFFRVIEKDLHYAVFSWKDPGPVIGTLLQSLKFASSKEMRRFVFNRGIS